MTRHTGRGRATNLTRRWAQRAVLDIARQSGGRIVTRTVFRDRPDLDMRVPSAEPMLGIRIAAGLEQAARRLAGDYVAQAREDGHAWHEIGTALGFAPVAELGVSIAEAAYGYAAGEPGTGRRSFAWVCPSCRSTVIDRGPEAGHPAECEQGHRTACPRLAATIAEWNASWEDEDGH